MDAGKWEPTDDAPFKITTYPGTEKVQYVNCLLCGETLFDDVKEGKEFKPELLTTIAIAHLEFSHHDILGPR